MSSVSLAPSTTETLKEERDYAVFVSRKEVQKIERQLLVSPSERAVNAAFRRICYAVLELADKYVPDNRGAIEERVLLANCVNMLQKMGFKPPVSSGLHVESIVAADTVRNSFEYRQIRNKMIAGLSVIADMVDRPASPGSKEFQRGVREGYRRARDTAVMFLEDVDQGEYL